VIHADIAAEVANLTVVDATGQQFQEPKVRLAARGDYNSTSGQMQFEQVELASDVLAVNAAGRIAPVSGVNNADIQGKLDYDMERLAALLRPYLGSGVRVVGRGTSQAYYRGAFSAATGQAAAGMRWDAANVYGLQSGPGELKAVMANGLVQFSPIDLTVSQGQMHLAPGLRLSPDPIELTLPKGPLAQQIQIDPVMCASTFKFIVPALADVSTVQGTFSIDLDGCRIPISAPGTGEVAGRLIIHSMNVGASPLTRTFSTFLKSESAPKLRQNSVIQFHMVGGRVYHQGLELVFPDMTIRTYGSVGFDQSVALMAEMPVPPKWAAQNAMAADAMKGQVIRVPIAGTLSKPELDQKVMADLTRQFIQKAAENAVQGEVNRQLDRLFGPRK
jgi:translocation and assembly module TamB